MGIYVDRKAKGNLSSLSMLNDIFFSDSNSSNSFVYIDMFSLETNTLSTIDKEFFTEVN